MLDLILLGGLSFLGTGPASSAVSVRGHTACPMASEVEAALVGMIAPPRPSDALDVVELAGDGQRVILKLTSASGEPIAEKKLPESSSCAERARTAAVIIAAREVRLHPGLQPVLPRLRSPAATPTDPAAVASTVAPASTLTSIPAAPPKPTPTPTSTLTPPPAQIPAAPPMPTPVVAPTLAPAAMPSPTPRPTPPIALRSPLVANTTAPPSTTAAPFVEPNPITTRAHSRSSGSVDIEPGVAALASVAAGTTTAPAVLIEARISPRGSPWALGVGGLAVGTHATDVGSGRGAWRRFGGILDLRSMARWRIADLEMRAGAALTAVSVTGQAFPVTSGTTTFFDPGIVVGLRSRFRLGRVSPWAEATATGWPGTHTLYVTGTTSVRDLPPFELFLGVGASLALYP